MTGAVPAGALGERDDDDHPSSIFDRVAEFASPPKPPGDDRPSPSRPARAAASRKGPPHAAPDVPEHDKQ